MTKDIYKTIRQRLGTQAKVAARLGVARSTVAHRESGKMTITEEAALAIQALKPRKAKKRNAEPCGGLPSASAAGSQP